MQAEGTEVMTATLDAGTAESRLQMVWAYARHELLYLCWALMEVALITPVALSAMAWTRFWPVAPFTLWLLLIMLVPFNLHRLLSLTEAPVRRRQNVLLLALVVTLVISTRALLFDPRSLFDMSWIAELFNHFIEPDNPLWGRDLGLFFLVVFTWWRGLSLTNRHVDFKASGLRLRVGGLILAPVVVGIGMLPGGPPALPFVLLFFLFGLMTVALTRAEEVAMDQTGHSYPMQPRWAGVIFLSSLLTVLIAGVAAAALSGEGLVRVLEWMEPLWQAMRLLATVVVIMVSYAAIFLTTPLVWLLRGLAQRFNVLPPGEPGLEVAPVDTGPTEINEMIESMRQPGLPEWVSQALVVLVIVAVLLLLYAAFARYFRERVVVVGSGEMAGAPTSDGEEGMGLGERIRRRLGSWRRRRAAASIRRIYEQMGALAAAAGYPRAPAETPYEYLTTLAEVWPEGTAETQLITQAYVNVRYGELPETQEELDEIRAAWGRLQEMDLSE
ncbi:MAG: DUF4129 domain-containing protein [Candidatus Promineifilaceae bacterium]|nr:DUF4129 domain-containing protein [Candidatus Promineifilaceae bacterium]